MVGGAVGRAAEAKQHRRVKLSEAVASLGLGWEGAEHCALDDCRNTSRLLGKIIEHGHPVYLTSALPHAP